MSVPEGLHVVQDLTWDLRVGEVLLPSHAAERMTSLIEVAKRIGRSRHLTASHSRRSGISPATPKISRWKAHEQDTRRRSFNRSKSHAQSGWDEIRQEPRRSTATCSQALSHSPAEDDLNAEDSSHVPIGPFVINPEEEPVNTANQAGNATETMDATRMRPAARPQSDISHYSTYGTSKPIPWGVHQTLVTLRHCKTPGIPVKCAQILMIAITQGQTVQRQVGCFRCSTAGNAKQR